MCAETYFPAHLLPINSYDRTYEIENNYLSVKTKLVSRDCVTMRYAFDDVKCSKCGENHQVEIQIYDSGLVKAVLRN